MIVFFFLVRKDITKIIFRELIKNRKNDIKLVVSVINY